MKTLTLSLVSLAVLSNAVYAADLPTKKSEPVQPAPVWQGLYVGLNAGGIWANDNKINNTETWGLQSSSAYNFTSALLSGSVPASGTAAFIGGVQVGYNIQFDNLTKLKLLAGVEADIQGVTPGGSSGRNTYLGVMPSGGGNQTENVLISRSASNTLSYIGTVRGRAGIILTPTIHLYGTGGLAYGGTNVNLQNFAAWSNGYQSGASNYGKTQVGWAAGGGFEWLFKPNWSLKGEYLYYDLGKASGTVSNYGTLNGGAPVLASITQYTSRFNGNILRAGVNYHLNWESNPVVAKF